MISQIISIKNIGAFQNQPPVDMDSLTLIHGPNGSGKSTLADIFRSLWENHPEIILNRKRIAASQRPGMPEVELAFWEDATVQKDVVRFSDQGWRQPSSDWVFEIFDAHFIDKNIFTGLSHTRANRVSLSNLMMGQETVIVGKEVETLKREKRETSKKLAEVRSRLSAAGVGAVDEFLLAPKPDDREALARLIAGLKEDERRMQKIVEEALQIQALSLPEPVSLACVGQCKAAMAEVVDTLSITCQEMDEDVALQLKAHIKKHFLHPDGREHAWIEKGLSYAGNNAPKTCPFCGGSPDPEGGLFDLYQRLFNFERREHVTQINDSLSDACSRWRQGVAGLQDLNSLVWKNWRRTVRFQEYLDQSFDSEFKKLDAAARELPSYLEDCQKAVSALDSDFSEKVVQKQETPFSSVALEEKEPAMLVEKLQSLSATVERFNITLQALLKPISTLKSQCSWSDLMSKLRDIQEEIAKKNMAAMRHDLDNDVQTCLILQADLGRMARRINQLKQDIETGSKIFARHFFHQVQEIFQFISGQKFVDVRADFDTKGYQPIYGFNLHFMGKAVQKHIPFVLSNADRKTLALSVYFASLRNRKQNDSLKRTIAILDDPVSGLDDKRAGQVLQYIWRVSKSCRQTVVLSHQHWFLENIRDKVLSEKTPFVMLHIEEQNSQSILLGESVEPSMKTRFSSDRKIVKSLSHDSQIQMVCLANSRKYGGLCVAGKEIMEDSKPAGRWIRPISQEEWGKLSIHHVTLQDGATPCLLDILTVPIQERAPRMHQQENAIIDPTRSWRSKGRFPIERLPTLTDDVEALWINGCDSRYGLNDRVPQDVAESRIRTSLLFIQPTELRICVEEFVNSPLKIRAKFHFKDVEYWLTATDPVVEFAYSQKPLGEYLVSQPDVYLCVSLGEPFEGYCYKLAAGFVNLNEK